MPKEIDEIWPQIMRGGIARQFRRKRVESLAGGRLHQVLGAPARDKRGTAAIANEPLDRRQSLAELGVEDACMLPHQSEETGGLGHAGHHQPTALAFGKELAGPLPAPHRAGSVLPELEKAAILLPFAEILLPPRRKGPDLAMDEAAHTALCVDPFLEPVGREAAQLPKAGGVGDERPYRRRRLGETTFLAVAIDCRHSIASRSWQELAEAVISFGNVMCSRSRSTGLLVGTLGRAIQTAPAWYDSEQKSLASSARRRARPS